MKINGLPVVDAKRPLEVHITSYDCKEGKKKQATACAAARAIMREVPNCSWARVHTTRVYVLQGKHWIKYITPVSLQREIIAFDRGGTFEPGTHKLRKITTSQQAGTRALRNKAYREKRKANPNKNTRKHHLTAGVRQRLEGYRIDKNETWKTK